MSSANSVAKEVVRISGSGPLPDLPTSYRLQCLLYYAQGWSLVLRDSELFPDDITALDEGPAVPAVIEVKGEDPPWQLIRPDSFGQEPDLDDEDEVVFLRHLWLAYGDLSPSGLFALIQSEPPFLKAKKEREGGGKGLIGMNDLRESFSHRPGIPAALEAYRRHRQDRERDAELAILSSPPLDKEAIWKGCRSVTPSTGQR
jgi:uncharacterized phage-associated protein